MLLCQLQEEVWITCYLPITQLQLDIRHKHKQEYTSSQCFPKKCLLLKTLSPLSSLSLLVCPAPFLTTPALVEAPVSPNQAAP